MLDRPGNDSSSIQGRVLLCWNCGNPVESSAAFCPKCGQILLVDKYRVLSRIGPTGTSSVYKCIEPTTRAPVAVKRFQPSSDGSGPASQELELLQSVQHANVVRVLEARPTDGFVVLEWIDGGSLRDLIDSDLAKAQSQFVRTMTDVCEGLRELHRQRICHLDLKPENILIDSDGGAKIADFGVARVVSSQRE